MEMFMLDSGTMQSHVVLEKLIIQMDKQLLIEDKNKQMNSKKMMWKLKHHSISSWIDYQLINNYS